jgi:hypothetical protein
MHADLEAIEFGITHLAAQKDFRESMPDELAGAKLSL